jgi:hypothetical protein
MEGGLMARCPLCSRDDGFDETLPIIRLSHGDLGFSVDALSVAALMEENEGYEDSARVWIEELLAHGEYDDSDRSAGVVVLYFAGDREQLRRQYDAWQATQERGT